MTKWFIAGGIIIIAGAGVFFFQTYHPPKEGLGPIVGENLEGEADPGRMTLDMTTWRWISALYNNGRELRPAKPNSFTLKFTTDGKFSATTDCNSMSGTYTASAGAISFGSIASTKMYCEGSQEGDFALLLEETDHYHFTSRGELILNLKSDSGSAVFR